MKIPLFVYGSLMKGEPLHGYLAGLDVRQVRTRGKLFRLPAGYPALVPGGGDGWAMGELVSLPSMSKFMVLDLVEGVDRGLYSRRKIHVEWQGQNLNAWAYVMTLKQVEESNGTFIPSGNWRKVPRSTR